MANFSGYSAISNMTKEQLNAEIVLVWDRLIILSKAAAHGMPGSRLRRKRSEVEEAYVKLRKEYENLYGSFDK